MTEPFDINEQPAGTNQGGAAPKPTFWDQLVEAWNTLWKQTLIIGRKSETLVQLPLMLAILLGVAFPHLAALIFVLGIVMGYTFKVVSR